MSADKTPRRFIVKAAGGPQIHGCYFPGTDLVVWQDGTRGTGEPKSVKWLDDEPSSGTSPIEVSTVLESLSRELTREAAASISDHKAEALRAVATAINRALVATMIDRALGKS